MRDRLGDSKPFCVLSQHSIRGDANPEYDSAAYAVDDQRALEGLVWRSYASFFAGERVKRLYRMLAICRYDDARCRELYERIFIERPLELQKTIFARLVHDGAFDPCDALLAAVEFHGAMFMLIEAEADPGKAEEFCRRRVSSFNSAHRKVGGK